MEFDGKTPAPILRKGVFRSTNLIRRGLGFGRVDLDAAFEMGAVLDADARRGNISDDRAILLDIDAAARMEITDDFAEDNHVASLNFGIELSRGANGEFVAAK